MQEYIQSTTLHLGPVEGKLTEELTPPLGLGSRLEGYTVESVFTTDHERISLKQIREQVAEHMEEPHKVEIFVNALVDNHTDLCDDPAELQN